MAGGSAEDNPVAINVTAMVDVIFCLCLFFMCSLHFKQLEGKIETWLPKDRGVMNTQVEKVVLEEIRVFMRWDAGAAMTTRRIGNRPPASSDDDLLLVITAMRDDYRKAGKPLSDIPVLIDAMPDVPWKDVIHVMDLCKQKDMERIEFAAPIEVPVRPTNP